MKRRRKYKTFKKKKILDTYELLTCVELKKCWNKEVSEYIMDPSQTNNSTYIGRTL